MNSEIVQKLEEFGSDAIRMGFQDVSPDTVSAYKRANGWVSQPKWDGWFVALVVKDEKGVMYSRKERYRENLDCKGLKDNIYLGELIENTQWSYKFAGGIHHGKFVIFDALDRGNYFEFLKGMENSLLPPWVKVINIDNDEPEDAFKTALAAGFEGVVLYNVSTEERIKVKKVIEGDYIIMRFEESDSETAKARGGMVKALVYGDGKREIGQCGSMPHSLKIDMFKNPQKYLGRTVTISGKERFESGALRHPSFVYIRDARDK